MERLFSNDRRFEICVRRDILQGSVAIHLKCGGILIDNVILNFFLFSQ